MSGYSPQGHVPPHGYVPPSGYGMPPKKSGGGSTVAIIIAVVLVVVLGGGVVVCGGIGFFMMRASNQYNAELANIQVQSTYPTSPPMAQTMPAPSEMGMSEFQMPLTEDAKMAESPLTPEVLAQQFSSESIPSPPAAADEAGEQVTAEMPLAVGDKLLAHWGGKWNSVQVLELRDDGQVKIHWDGWSDTWDEFVPRERLRKPLP